MGTRPLIRTIPLLPQRSVSSPHDPLFTTLPSFQLLQILLDDVFCHDLTIEHSNNAIAKLCTIL